MEVTVEPSKGRIVTYHCTDGERYLGCGDDMTLPAIIVGLIPGVMKGVNLVVFANSTAMLTLRTAVPFGIINGGWSWPGTTIDTAMPGPLQPYIEDTKTEAPPLTIPNPSSNMQPFPPPSPSSTHPPLVPKVT